jgi:S-DNA-T family DNA segregation ATPase FtsK/SpoIIIE
VKWLPHTEALRPGRLLTGLSDGSATRLFEELRELQAERAAGRASLVTGATTLLPHVVVLVQPPLPLAAADVASFLEECPKMGMSVMWIAQDRGSLPGAAQVVVEAGAFGGTLTHTAGGKQVTRVTLDGLSLASATEAAMALAPLRDRARGAASTTLPDRVDLIDLLDPVPLTGDAVVARWSQTPKSLLTQVGMGTGAPASLDLDRDGPHGLIAGTTGSGKSELLQTLVASLAATFPPTRVNFVLVDYKGGAAFKECVALPHTVGFVTDLDEHLAERAIVSLNAELVRRERLLASAGFKDLPAMRIKNAAAAPPDLLLIVDEFAALKAEVPRFIDGVVDIARRGRSLGIHLLLATQKPRGVISGDIQANTNLRIVLRVTDPEESTDVIGRPDAARLSRHRPGRALVKTGPMEVAEIQVAHAGGTAPRRRNLEPARLFTAESRAIPATRSSGTAPTHLAAIVAACVEAARQAGLPAPRRPWLAELPHLVQLDSLDTGRPEVPSAAIAQADDTNSQAQPPWVLDLARAGSAVIYGSAGTGKTTALRTIAAALARTYSTDEVHLYGLDFAGRGLAPLTSLPHCGDVVYGEEQERVRRLITMLEGMVLERRALLATIGASSAAEYWRLSGESLPSVVVLVDGLSQLWESLEKVDRGTLLDAVQRLVAEGRAAGLHFVLTADRRGAVPHALHAVVPVRIALRLANPDEYAMLGLLLPKAYQKAPPGRAWVESEEIQFAVPIDGPDAGGAAQTKALAALGKRLAVGSVKPVPVRLLPGHILLKDLPAPGLGQRHVPIGLDEHSLAPIAIDLGHQASFLVAGPSGSGRTTVLRVLGTGLRRAFPDAQCFLIGSRRSDLFDEPWWVEKARALPDAEALAARLVEQMAAREASTPPGPLLVVAIDDADPYTEGRIASSIELLVNRAEDANAVVLVAMSTFRAGRGYAPWVQALRHQGSGLLLQPRDDTDGDVFHLILPRRSGVAMPAGRGYLIQGSAVTLIQAAE